MCFKHDKRALRKMFTHPATERALESPWDEDAGCAINPNIRDAEQFLEDDSDMTWLQDTATDTKTASTVDNAPPAKAQLLVHLPNDDSSLATFGHESATTSAEPATSNQKDNTQSTSDPPLQVAGAAQPVSVAHDLTTGTMETVETRFANIESNVAHLNSTISTKLDLIFKTLGSSKGSDSTLGVCEESPTNVGTSSNTPDPQEGEGAGPE